MQENSFESFKKEGDQQFTLDGRDVEITVDLVLEARAKMSDNKVNGLGDAVASWRSSSCPWRRSQQSRGASKSASWARWRRQVRGRL